MRRGIDRRRDGSYRVRLPSEERDVLAALPAQLREALDAGEPTLYRLFPPAFVSDDDANLEYARKQTDLVLETLSDQLNRKKIDKDLLKKLGWSEDDLRKFVERWRDRKQAAKRNDPSGDAAKRELDEALRSLGLRPGPLKQGQVKDDTMRNLREGYRGAVPPEYQDRLRAYNQGVSRARGDDGRGE